MAEKAKIITDLTRKHVPTRVPWTPEHQKALDDLKAELYDATALHTFDFCKEFGLMIDASSIAVGCCLIQWSDEGIEKLIAFTSMKLSPTQQCYFRNENENEN